jgi:hypothetical protein
MTSTTSTSTAWQDQATNRFFDAFTCNPCHEARIRDAFRTALAEVGFQEFTRVANLDRDEARTIIRQAISQKANLGALTDHVTYETMNALFDVNRAEPEVLTWEGHALDLSAEGRLSGPHNGLSEDLPAPAWLVQDARVERVRAMPRYTNTEPWSTHVPVGAVGAVLDVDMSDHTVRVRFDEKGTGWLPWVDLGPETVAVVGTPQPEVIPDAPAEVSETDALLARLEQRRKDAASWELAMRTLVDVIAEDGGEQATRKGYCSDYEALVVTVNRRVLERYRMEAQRLGYPVFTLPEIEGREGEWSFTVAVEGLSITDPNGNTWECQDTYEVTLSGTASGRDGDDAWENFEDNNDVAEQIRSAVYNALPSNFDRDIDWDAYSMTDAERD